MERKKLILWEKENGFKAKDVAKKLGITEQTWCNIKSGKSTPSLDFAFKFGEAFPNTNVLELFEITQKGN